MRKFIPYILIYILCGVLSISWGFYNKIIRISYADTEVSINALFALILLVTSIIIILFVYNLMIRMIQAPGSIISLFHSRKQKIIRSLTRELLVYVKLNELPKAITLYEKIIKLDPRFYLQDEIEFILYIKQEDVPEDLGFLAYEEAKIFQYIKEAKNAYDSGDVESLERNVKNLKSNYSDITTTKNIETLLEEAKVKKLIASNKTKMAIKKLESSNSLMEDPKFIFTLARLYIENDQEDKALLMLKKLWNIHPDRRTFNLVVQIFSKFSYEKQVDKLYEFFSGLENAHIGFLFITDFCIDNNLIERAMQVFDSTNHMNIILYDYIRARILLIEQNILACDKLLKNLIEKMENYCDSY